MHPSKEHSASPPADAVAPSMASLGPYSPVRKVAPFWGSLSPLESTLLQQDYSLHKSGHMRYPRRRRDLRAMTMSVGFLCSDGVVISADRQVTNPASGYTFHEQKLGILSVNGVVRHIWSYAGNVDTAKKLARELRTKLPTQSVSKKEAELLLRTALKKCLKPREHFYTLFGTYVPKGDPVLWMASGLDVLEIERCEIIGTADSP